jgi:DNA-binding NtrC family response regulator
MKRPVEVLVLDDESVVCDRLKDHFETKGHHTEIFYESQRAIDRLADKWFDVVITDLKMEGPTGLDVLHFVRQHCYGTQVIIITGYAEMDSAREAEYGGVFDFVTKPFSLKTIEATVKKAAKRARRLKDKETK